MGIIVLLGPKNLLLAPSTGNQTRRSLRLKMHRARAPACLLLRGHPSAVSPEATKSLSPHRLAPGLRMLQEGVVRGHPDSSVRGGCCQEIAQNKAKRRRPQTEPLAHCCSSPCQEASRSRHAWEGDSDSWATAMGRKTYL